MTTESTIRHTEGGSMYSGKEAVNVFACYVVASAMKLYAKTGIKANRAYTSTNMLAFVQRTTGMKFKRTQMLEASQFLTMWANAKRYGIKEVSTRPVDIAHQYAVLRWCWDEPAQLAEDIKNLGITKAADVFEAVDNIAADCALGDPFADWQLSPDEVKERQKAIANLKELAK